MHYILGNPVTVHVISYYPELQVNLKYFIFLNTFIYLLLFLFELKMCMSELINQLTKPCRFLMKLAVGKKYTD